MARSGNRSALLDLKTVIFLLEPLQHSDAILGLAQLSVKLRQAVGTMPHHADVTTVIVPVFRFRVLHLPELLVALQLLGWRLCLSAPAKVRQERKQNGGNCLRA